MILKCNCCGRTDELSPLRIGRKHAKCFAGGRWTEAGMAVFAAMSASANAKATTKRRKEPRK